MSLSFNRVILAGNLTRDPELSFTANNTPVCKFGMAINRKFKDKEDVCFVDVAAFGKQGEVVYFLLKQFCFDHFPDKVRSSSKVFFGILYDMGLR